jgi:RNA polymerase sigma-70 factor (ECF subfamily)
MSRESTGPAEPSAPLDEATLRRVREGDEAAMNRFFDAFFDRVFAYVTRLVRDRTLAEDLTQDSFVRMHGALGRLDPARDPTPWVFTVVTNTVRDHWRSRAHRATMRQSSLEDVGELPSDDGRGAPDRALERKESARAVRAAMGRLSDADREILLLRNFRSLTTEEIVEILGIRPEAVRQRYSRAVRRLGRAYRELRGGQDPVSA